MIVIGIDPGSRHFGYGLVEAKTIKLIHAGTFHLSHIMKIPERLHFLYKSLKEIVELYKPSEMAIEKAFVGKKIPSSFVLSYTRAMALLVAGEKNIPVYEYNSTEIKKALTGYGRAHKIQIKSMVKNFLNHNGKVSYDCSDALAVAICHINSKNCNFLNK
jgi:crossover junction endodeoxyribonuclease RuvC